MPLDTTNNGLSLKKAYVRSTPNYESLEVVVNI
jgi:hypothetical protein